MVNQVEKYDDKSSESYMSVIQPDVFSKMCANEKNDHMKEAGIYGELVHGNIGLSSFDFNDITDENYMTHEFVEHFIPAFSSSLIQDKHGQTAGVNQSDISRYYTGSSNNGSLVDDKGHINENIDLLDTPLGRIDANIWTGYERKGHDNEAVTFKDIVPAAYAFPISNTVSNMGMINARNIPSGYQELHARSNSIFSDSNSSYRHGSISMETVSSDIYPQAQNFGPDYSSVTIKRTAPSRRSEKRRDYHIRNERNRRRQINNAFSDLEAVLQGTCGELTRSNMLSMATDTIRNLRMVYSTLRNTKTNSNYSEM